MKRIRNFELSGKISQTSVGNSVALSFILTVLRIQLTVWSQVVLPAIRMSPARVLHLFAAHLFVGERLRPIRSATSAHFEDWADKKMCGKKIIRKGLAFDLSGMGGSPPVVSSRLSVQCKTVGLPPIPLSSHLIDDGVQGWTGAHGSRGLDGIGMIVASDVDRFPLCCIQLSHYFGFVRL